MGYTLNIFHLIFYTVISWLYSKLSNNYPVGTSRKFHVEFWWKFVVDVDSTWILRGIHDMSPLWKFRVLVDSTWILRGIHDVGFS